MNYLTNYPSLLGNLTLVSDGKKLTGLWLEGQKIFKSNLTDYEAAKELPIFSLTKEWLDLYFQGVEPDFMPPLSLPGTPFRQAVWDILLSIPYGETTTYGEIAKQMAKKTGQAFMSAQAIGGAVGHNPISIIVPCHRVLGAGNTLIGYGGGLDKKVKLLTLEHAYFVE